VFKRRVGLTPGSLAEKLHLNGRIYDPLIGRMMSADSMVRKTHYLVVTAGGAAGRCRYRASSDRDHEVTNSGSDVGR
jgi:hypothetical protein